MTDCGRDLSMWSWSALRRASSCFSCCAANWNSISPRTACSRRAAMHLKSSSLACLSDGVGASSLNCLLKLPRVSHFGTPQAPPRRATA